MGAAGASGRRRARGARRGADARGGDRAALTRSASPKLTAYAALAALGLIGALAARRAEAVVLAAPFAAILAAGLAAARPPQVRAYVHVDGERALERDDVSVELELWSEEPVARLEVALVLPRGLDVSEGAAVHAVLLEPDEPRTLSLALRPARWGSYAVGELRFRTRDPLGLLVWEWSGGAERPLRVFPRPETLADLVRPLETQLNVGNEVARAKGHGIELADLRPYAPGDRLRDVNWRASARRDSLVVNERHPERNADVVLFVDAFAEARGRQGSGSTLDDAVRAAATLAQHYLERRDRVALVGFGGILRWLEPGMGARQRYRFAEALLETEVEFSYAWKDVNVIPARVLPPQALVVALSPLLDDRSIGALLDLRGRGFDLALVEVSPEPYAHEPRSELDALAHRLWRLRRAELRSRFERLGVAVSTWRRGEPLELPLGEVREYRRHARVARG